MADRVAGVLEKIKNFSDAPGVYIMKDKRGRVIYVGKAKSLKKRVHSYFTGEKDPKTRLLVEHIDDIETIITRSEYEALTTENSLIKRWQPKYNIELKDGKTYPVIRLTNEEYPRLYRTRRLVFDGSRYFGPFPGVEDLDVYLSVVERLYPLRKCRGPIPKKPRPCLYYHIGRCAGPCAHAIGKEAYAERVARVVKLLEGGADELFRELEAKMREAAAALQYERAATYRDQLEAVNRLTQAQKHFDPNKPTEDYLGLAIKENFASFAVVKTQGGALVGKEIFRTRCYSAPEEALNEFLFQYYAKPMKPPEAVFTPFPPEPETVRAFTETFGRRLGAAATGSELSLSRMAQANAEQDMAVSRVDGLAELQSALGLEALPLRIEGFDIAHLAGKHTVGSLVSFLQGKPDKAAYRRFKLRSLHGAVDDFESLREVVARRYMRLLAENEPLPDLILIDGGKGQLESARGVLSSLGLEKVPVIGLAKKREEVFTVGGDKPIRLPFTSPALRLLVAVRDESHRFATTFHKLLRDRETASSYLEKIKGIGGKKARLLLLNFRSLEKIAAAPIPELAKTARVSEAVALGIAREVKKVLGE
ncbi:MAG: excinuclease ABC subunit UvrC [Spirochaetales bacterium]|nr:excinuclease ABC subunit UvrC [Spirochaetales bacterium]